MSKYLPPLIPPGLSVRQVAITADHLTINANPLQTTAVCPTCAVASLRVHSHYARRLSDLPSQGRRVTLCIQARRFRCLNPTCPRQTFAERLTDIAAVAARRTTRLGRLQCDLVLALGGEAGARLADRLALSTSPDTLLRMARRTADTISAPVPRVLAVDDWAWRRGHSYGTILVDLERNRVVDLLPDRQAGTLAAWLRQHPGIEVIARDRAGAYADGARQGAPDATQVADRWHLLQNLSMAVQAVMDRSAGAVRRSARHVADEMIDRQSAPPALPPPAAAPTASQRRSQAALARRQTRYEEAARLRQAGMSINRIAVLMGAERKTIRSWLRLGHAPLWRKPPRCGGLDGYMTLLDRRWTEGCHNAAQLWRELVEAGFTGRPRTVRAWASRRRKAEATGGVGLRDAPWHPPSGSQLARLLLADDTRADPEQSFVARVLAEVPGLAPTIAFARRLSQLLRRESKEHLVDVLNAAAGTTLAPFARALRRDLAAVQAALDLPWTTSPAEGQINRIKTIKRTMYGRAGFPLLRARVLAAP